jgi:hypothetical protein
MNPIIKDMWVKALKSGEFKQGREFLEKDGKYCALGILSLLSLVEGHCTYNEVNGLGRFDNKRFTLSYNTLTWARMDLEDFKAEVIYEGEVTSIGDLNDRGLSFKELARIINLKL